MSSQLSASPKIELVCAGTHREMGIAQGRQLRAKIHDAIRACSAQDSFRIDQPWWLSDTLFIWLAELKAGRLLTRPLIRDFPEANDRLAGMAEGAELGMRTVYLMNAVEPLMAAVKSRSAAPAMAACSAIALRGRRSATGEPMIARNFDYLPPVQPYFTLRETRPRRRLRSLDFTVATMAGAVDGMNERGLAITYNYAYAVDDGPPSAPISMVISEALERCGSVSEAAGWIARRPRWGGGMLMLADAAGDIAALEISNTRTRLRRPAGDDDLLFHTNHFNTREMAAVEVSPRAVFTERAHPSMRGRRVLESAERRSQRLAQLLRGDVPLDCCRLGEILADHGPTGVPSEMTVCVHGTARRTTACLQLFPRSRRMRVSYTTACQARFEEFSL